MANKILEKNSFDDDFVSKSDWLFGDDKLKLKSILDGMTIDEVQEYLGYWWILENANASKGIYTFTRPVWGTIIVHTDKKNKVQFVESKKNKKSLKEGINDTEIGRSSDGEYVLYLENCRSANHGKDPHFEIGLSSDGYSMIYVRTDDNRCEEIVNKWIKKYNIIFDKKELENALSLKESKKSTRKNLKEYRTMGFEQEVREKCIEILEEGDLFDDGSSDAIITYYNKGLAKTNSIGDVWIDYITMPLYCWSSGYYPFNKDTKKLVDNIVDYNMELARERLWNEHEDELVELGIEDKNDDKLEYNELYDLGAGDLAEELSEYEMDSEGTELFTQVSCEITDTDNGIELTVSMIISDEYGRALVKNYKSNSVVITEDTKDIEDVIFDCIKSVTKNW